MVFLGVFNGNCASVTIIRDNKLEYAALEERFTRKKFDRTYPINALTNGLETLNLETRDINVVACGAWDSPSMETIADYLEASNLIKAEKATARLFHSLASDNTFKLEYAEKSRALFSNAKIRTFDHHYSHACTAFYCSNFEESWVLTCDGRGDLQSTVIWQANREDGLKRVKTMSELRSLGALYGQVTSLLGFIPDRHEGKVTGLAAYGNHTELLERIEALLGFDGETIRPSIEFVPFLRGENESLQRLCRDYRKEDIAYAVQGALENSIIGLIHRYIPKGVNLAVAGGVFANVKLNQRITERCDLADTFVFPEMGDGGNSAGGAIAAAVEHGVKQFEFKHVYLGPEYDWFNVDLSGLKVENFTDSGALASRVAKLISEGRFVGVFLGRMEFGPRALGARSILISARNRDVIKEANKRLNRDDFMPLAPITLPEMANELFVGWSNNHVNSRFMTTCYVCTEKMKEICPGAVHVDGTARPQVVDSRYAPKLLINILREYIETYGEPALANTSFNNHEEPIVCTPEDAIDSLMKGNVDYIVSENLLISLNDSERS